MLSISVKDLAELTRSTFIGEDPDHMIYGVDCLETAKAGDASFLANPYYKKTMAMSNAGVILLHPSIEITDSKNYLVNESPSRAFQETVEFFHSHENAMSGFKGVHSTAIIHSTAKIGENVSIGPYAVIDCNVTISNNSSIGSSSYIGPNVKIGALCTIHSNVTIRENSILYNNIVLQPGAVIGSCGFGYITDKLGSHNKLEQVGSVIIEDDVEIGANTTIDRSRFKTTIIKKGTKVDNLVQIGHGVEVGENNLIVAQTGIAGSSKTGKQVVLAGQCAIVGHISVADGTIIGGRGAVTKSIRTAGQRYGGAPAKPAKDFYRTQAHLNKLDLYVKKIKKLENEIKELKTSRKQEVSLV